MSVAENVKKIKNSLPPSVTLVGVTKLKPVSLIREAFEAGHRDFGENYVQELIGKQDELGEISKEIRWHLIGSLQRNKVKYIVGRVFLIHSVDRIELAKEISKLAVERGLVQDILVQVNLGGEETKHGTDEASLGQLLSEALKLPGVRIKGLMAMPPLSEKPEDGRPWFQLLRKLRDKLEGQYGIKLPELSMGTSADYEVAIEEGATIVRVGTVIFGERAG